MMPSLIHSTLLTLMFTISTLATPFPPSQHPLTLTKNCSSQITQSLSATYAWNSATALALAQCLLLHPPPPSTCIFYTRSARAPAIRYALETNRTTIYDVYPPLYFNTSVSPAKDWDEAGHLRDLFKITSKAYAIACEGSATVVLPEGEEPCPGSIWVTDEYDAIRNGQSRIELPVWRVSWSVDLKRWVRRVLDASIAGGGRKVGRRDVGKRERVQRALEDVVSERVSRAEEVLKQRWGWAGEDGDPWAIVEEKCER
jgi:hypothetical protein